MHYSLILAKKPLDLIDQLLDRLTTYRLVLYCLIVYVAGAMALNLGGKLTYHWQDIATSTLVLCGSGWAFNKLAAGLLQITPNKESSLITALILALILTPATTTHGYLILLAAAAAATAVKYIAVIHRAHIFNPAAAGAFIAGALFHNYASWWVGNKYLTPLVIVGGLLIARKIKRIQMAGVFGAVYFLLLIWAAPSGTTTDALRHLIWLSLISSPLVFFATVMLDEPLTSPIALARQIDFALLVGILYSWRRLHLAPEQALLLGNIFSFIIAPKRRFILEYVRSIKEAEGIFTYQFKRPTKFNFKAGQYMEWTLGGKMDDRGNRRYLTLASAPSEEFVSISVRQPPKPSAFKRKLASLKPGDKITASYLAGSFTLPPNTSRKLAFMAGGVGITPFRSMIKDLVDNNQPRDIRLVYSANQREELAFGAVFSSAARIGLKGLYTPKLNADFINANVPDWAERTFYISGPYGYVKSTEDILLRLGLSPARIITDYFPGYNS